MLCRDPEYGDVPLFLREKYKVEKDYEVLRMALEDPRFQDINQLHKFKNQLEIQSKAFRAGMI